MTLSPELHAKLLRVSAATVHTVLFRKGIRRTFLHGPRPLSPDQGRVVGEAYTLRFVPVREDLVGPGRPHSRTAIEQLPAGCVCVADAMGITGNAIFGDILTARIQARKAAALITDGAVRDADGIRAMQFPVWCAGVAVPASMNGFAFAGSQQPIACGGVAVTPGDVMIADGDGVVCIPAAMAAEVADEALEQEEFEAWVVDEVKRGAALPGLYPPNDETKARYAAFRSTRDGKR